MKPKAALKFANTKVFVMASRPGMSFQPESRAICSARAGGASLAGRMTVFSCSPPAAVNHGRLPDHTGRPISGEIITNI
jgi:hypothetical protein